MPHSTNAHISLPLFAVMAVFFGLLVPQLHGQSNVTWGQKMFEATEIDFGTVPRGSIASIQVNVKNVYREDIHVTDIRVIHSGQSSAFLAWAEHEFPIVVSSGNHVLLTLRADAIRFAGERKSMAKVELLYPVHQSTTSVEIPARILIRQDVVVVNRDGASFGAVELGKGAERTIELRYTGKGDWQLTKTKCSNPHLEVSFREKSREDGEVAYDLTVKLKPDAPKGRFEDRILVTTNEANRNPDFWISIDGRVEPEISATDITFADMKAGQVKSKTMVVHAKKPIEIVEIAHEKRADSRLQNEAFTFKFDGSAKLVHAIPVTFTAPERLGPFDEIFLLKILNREESIPFHVRGQITNEGEDK